MKVAVLGSGAYGIALASIFYENKNEVCIWTNNEEEQKLLNKKRVSPKLENYKIPKDIIITNDIKETIKNANLIVIAVPAFAVDSVSILLAPIIGKKQHILIASKGIEQDTCLFLSDVIKKYINTKRYAVISGPTFAKDIVLKTPIGLSIASENNATIKLVKKLMENETTKLRATNDVVGVEICGSIKNVIAIASGILHGMNVADSTKALFLTESLNDIKELIHALGGNKKTILSFAGFGDIYMTCSSENSRNHTFGKMIGENKSKKEIEEYKNTMTIEGLYTLMSIHTLIKNKKVDIPIINLIYDIILKDTPKEKLLEFLIQKK